MAGGDIFDAEGLSAVGCFDSPQTERALQFLIDLRVESCESACRQIKRSRSNKSNPILIISKQPSSHATNWPYQMAAAVVVMLPIMTVFFFAQRYLIKGITLTGLKGTFGCWLPVAGKLGQRLSSSDKHSVSNRFHLRHFRSCFFVGFLKYILEKR